MGVIYITMKFDSGREVLEFKYSPPLNLKHPINITLKEKKSSRYLCAGLHFYSIYVVLYALYGHIFVDSEHMTIYGSEIN